ncbi:GNAT family N-acetyltransferase [Natronolimnohabitans innermongolicus]|nr:GNAT family N-acetyltransferase [Natronolimnohabitans innermongolicus]
MSVHPTLSFDDELHRRIYEYVERNGAVSADELMRSIRVESDAPQSKPARSGTYTESVCPPSADVEACLETLRERGYLTGPDEEIRIALSALETEFECDDGTVRIRPAREADRDGLLETMRGVADESTYIVAENVATQLERDSALVRANEERSRVCFVASLERDAESETDEGDGDDPATEAAVDDSEIVGWLHLDVHELPSLSHTAELTVGVDPGYRRQGIGSSLLEYGLEWAARTGYHKVYQSLPATNEGAIAFLEDEGWEREGVRTEQYRIDGEFVDEVTLAAWP